MKRRPELTPERFAAALTVPAGGATLHVAFSGGLDSSVLLDLLSRMALPEGIGLHAIHVDHGLLERSGVWAQRCHDVCSGYGVRCSIRRIAVAVCDGQGLEAAAREARYAALRDFIRTGDVLVTAHHRDDQAETVLLRLMRGAGLQGLAGMAEVSAFGDGTLTRPLLAWGRSALMHYARARGLTWVDDPSNTDERFDRNYLRHRILPALQQRWPAADQLLARSAGFAAEGLALIRELAALDLESCAGDDSYTLALDAFAALGAPRRRNLLSYWIQSLGLSAPPGRRLEEAADTLAGARADAVPVVSWPGGELRRYRNRIYAMPPLPPEPGQWSCEWKPDGVLELPEGCGRLRAAPNPPAGRGLRLPKDARLRVGFRQGGERLRPLDQPHSKPLKQLWQEAGVAPWVRVRTPLLFFGEELVAVGDHWLAHAWSESAPGNGTGIIWERRAGWYPGDGPS